MFAKPAQYKPFAAIKGSERKKVLASIEKQLKLPESDVDLRSQLLPKAVQTARVTLHSGERVQVYSSEAGEALWILIRDSTYVPTVHTLLKLGDILPTCFTVRNTLDFLQNGADFMVRGIFGDRPEILKGQAVQIRTLPELGNELLAVGLALVPLNDPNITQGKGIQVVNVIGDTLTPNIKLQKLEAPASVESVETKSSQAIEKANPNTDEVGEVTQKLEETKLNEDEAEEENEDSLRTDEIDDAFEYALKKVLAMPGHTYPLPMATVAQLMGENLPYEHPALVIRRTSWKKLAKMLKWAAKKGLLDVKERQGGEIVVLASHVKSEDAVAGSRTPGTAKKASASKKPRGGLDAKQIYKPKSALKALFPEDLANKDKYYTASELRSLVSDYINQHQLGSKSEVTIDTGLRTALGLKQTVETLSREEISSRVIAISNVFHVIYSPQQEEKPKPRKGGIPSIKLKTERRGGNKVVTLVSGSEKFDIDPKDLAEKLRIVCAGSTGVNKVQGAEQVVVQGDHVAKITAFFEKEGLKSSWISRG